MLIRALGSAALAVILTTGALAAQGTATKEPESDGRPLSEWIAELKAPAPQTRNAAAYEIAGMGPAAAAAVPALIESLDDPAASVRFPVTVALGEIGPAAEAAVPKLLTVMQEDQNDEVASGAKRAIRHIKPQALAGVQDSDD
jgi:HEAT repeat protein